MQGHPGNPAPTIPRRSLEESVMYVVGLICATVVTGFAVYRWHMGEYRGAIINVGIVATVAVPLLLGRSHRLRHLALNLEIRPAKRAVSVELELDVYVRKSEQS